MEQTIYFFSSYCVGLNSCSLKGIAHHVPCVFEKEDLIVPRLTLLCKRPRRNLPQIAMEKLSEKASIAVCVTTKDFAAKLIKFKLILFHTIYVVSCQILFNS